MHDADVETLERATLAAVPPQALETLDVWLLALDSGTVGRAHSAVPLRHRQVDAQQLPRIEARYAARGLRAVFRVPQTGAFDAVRAALASRGYQPEQPTLTMTGPVAGLAELAPPHEVRLDTVLDEAWGAAFMGPGFDAVDGASRFAILRRGGDSVFARVNVEGRVAAVGLGCFSHGWCGVHGMRTALPFRGRGLASRILAALAGHARERGVQRAFLQVEEANTAAQKLYRRGGLAPAWAYEYWRRG